MKSPDRLHELFALYHTDQIGSAEFAELESMLRDSAEARRLFHRGCRLDSQLRRESENSAEEPEETSTVVHPVFRSVSWMAAAAAVVLLLAAVSWVQASRPKVIATLASSEDASWESSLPTEPGSKLTRGYMKLTSGIATIRFKSGTELMLESPAKLTLKSPMLAKLVSGAAVLNVPESAIGFVLETPQGKVVDHGTSFAVSVANELSQSKIEVIEGEVSVHHPGSEEAVRLQQQESATINDQVLKTYQGPLPEKETEVSPKVVRLGTGGRSYSVIRANKEKWLHPDKLTVKRRLEPGNHERRSFFAFDLSSVNFDEVEAVRLRLNQVPSGIGYATRLPVISRISVYGLTNPAKSDWVPGTTWEEGPAPEDGVKIGEIEIPRSEQRGSRVLQSEDLLNFLRERRSGAVTFILEREITDLKGGAPSLVHAFASDLHPEASGPTLEFVLKR